MSKKAKKVVGLLLSLTLLLAMSVNVFAAGSATSYGAVKATAVDANGNPVTLTMVAPTKTPSDAEAKAALGDAFAPKMYAYQTMDIDAGGAKDVTITFQVPVVKSTTKVGVLHHDGSAWEKVASTAGNGTITATFSSLSPVSLWVDEDTQANVAPTKSGGSPKTGEFGTTSVLAVIAVLAIGGAVVSYRKREEVR